jgi:hypothetical protein
MTEIREAEFRGINGIELESRCLKVVLLPSAGGKVASIVYKPTGREFLLQGKDTAYRPSSYDSDFLAGDVSGIDDMFPTISRCYYEAYPWAGICLPDHGEVWALEWDASVDGAKVAMSVDGVRLPYRLKKTAELLTEDTLRLSYTATNPTGFDMEFLWAAHMMVAAQKGCRQVAPAGMSRAVCTYSESGLIGGYGDTFEFPNVPQRDGSVYDAGVYRGDDADDFQKFYFKGEMSEGWYRLDYPDGHTLTIGFPTQTVPYLSGLNAEGGSIGIRCVHIEPCTAPFDRPDVAKLHGKSSVLKAKSEYKWHLDIRINREKA